MIHAITKPSRAETRLDVRLSPGAEGGEGGWGAWGTVGCTGMKRWFMYRHGRFSCIDPRHWGHSEKIGRYPLLYPPPAPLGLGLHSAENLQSARHFHENGSDRDDVEGGREMEWFHGRRRPFLTWGLHGQIQHRGGLWRARFNA